MFNVETFEYSQDKWVLMGHLKNYFSAEVRLYV